MEHRTVEEISVFADGRVWVTINGESVAPDAELLDIGRSVMRDTARYVKKLRKSDKEFDAFCKERGL